jgi:hypothetical protein
VDQAPLERSAAYSDSKMHDLLLAFGIARRCVDSGAFRPGIPI